MTDEQIRERLKMLRKATNGTLAVMPLPLFPDLEVGAEIRFGGDCEHGQEPCEHDRIVRVDRIATLTCDGCGFTGKLPAQMMPTVLAALVLCPRCMQAQAAWR